MEEEGQTRFGSRGSSFAVPAWLIELWIAAVLLTFFVIRIIGSGLGQHLLRSLPARLGL